MTPDLTDAQTEGPDLVPDIAVAAGLPLAEVTRYFRRAVAIAAGVGVAALVVTLLVSHIGVGMLFCVGLGLGIANGAAVQISAGRYAMRTEPDKKRFVKGVFGRLTLVSVVALVLVVSFRPDGLAVLFGLAFFQLLMLAAGAGSMIRTLRAERPDA